MNTPSKECLSQEAIPASTDPATLKQRIEDTVRELEHASGLPVWVLASSASVLAIANDGEEAYGPRGRVLHSVFSRLGLSWWAVQMLRALGITITFCWWVRALPVTRVEAGAAEVFVGFGAGPEARMYREFRAEADRPVAHVDQTDPRSLARIARPRLWTLLSTVWQQAKVVVLGLRSALAPSVRNHGILWLTSAAIRFCAYVYAKAWAEALPSTVTRLVFLSPDIPAFAALDSRSRTGAPIVEFWEHGLLQRSIIIPRFDKMVALNVPEAIHLQTRVPAAAVKVRSRTIEAADTPRERRLLFASVYTSSDFDKISHLRLIREVFAWASEEGLSSVVRLHPRETADFWAMHFPQIELDQSSESFSDCLARWRPMFVTSWFSTALMDALREGALPILLRSGSEYILPDLIFPLEQLALNWPSDRGALSNLANTPEAYRQRLQAWRRMAFGTDDQVLAAGNANSRS